MAAVGGGPRSLRDAAVRRLVELNAAGPLSREQVALAAQGLGVSDRTVWRWVAQAMGRAEQVTRPQFTLDDGLRRRLAFWRGNVAAVHRELVEAAETGGPPAPSLTTLHRAVRESLTPGDRAGLRKGEHAARAHDVFLRLDADDPGPDKYRITVYYPVHGPYLHDHDQRRRPT